VQWAGATLQAPHCAISAAGHRAQGVYVAYFAFGSPATRYGWCRAAHRRGGRRPTPDLDAFLKVVGVAPIAACIKTLSWNGQRTRSRSARSAHWPTYELRRTDAGWEQRALGGRPRLLA
jgi:hypothetical protein